MEHLGNFGRSSQASRIIYDTSAAGILSRAQRPGDENLAGPSRISHSSHIFADKTGLYSIPEIGASLSALQLLTLGSIASLASTDSRQTLGSDMQYSLHYGDSQGILIICIPWLTISTLSIQVPLSLLLPGCFALTAVKNM